MQQMCRGEWCGVGVTVKVGRRIVANRCRACGLFPLENATSSAPALPKVAGSESELSTTTSGTTGPTPARQLPLCLCCALLLLFATYHAIMNLLQLFRVETLDSRFASKSTHPLPNTQASRWRTGEYYAYAFAFATIPFFMFKSVYDVSQPSHPSYQQYSHLLEDGWVPGRKVDNSDAQYRSFRDNIPYMGIVLLAHPLLRRIHDKFSSSEPEKVHSNPFYDLVPRHLLTLSARQAAVMPD